MFRLMALCYYGAKGKEVMCPPMLQKYPTPHIIKCHTIYFHISIINRETLDVFCCNLQLKITFKSQLLQMRELLHS